MRLAVFICVACVGLAQTDYEQGTALFQKGEFASAIAYLKRAAAAHPDDAQAWKALGVTYAALTLYGDAEASLARACTLKPALEDACYFHARALYGLDRFEESLAVLERAPKNWKVRMAQGQALEAMGRNAEGEKAFRETVAAVQNRDPRPGIAYGLFLVRQGRLEESIAPLQAVVERFPASAEAQLYLGRARLELGNVAEAIPLLERAVSLDGASAQAHLLLAKAYTRAGRAADARPHFEEASKRAQ